MGIGGGDTGPFNRPVYCIDGVILTDRTAAYSVSRPSTLTSSPSVSSLISASSSSTRLSFLLFSYTPLPFTTKKDRHFIGFCSAVRCVVAMLGTSIVNLSARCYGVKGCTLVVAGFTAGMSLSSRPLSKSSMVSPRLGEVGPGKS
jgi:hypothetical protein